MATATLTTKGQVTIPREVRKKLGVDVGDRVEFVETTPGVFALQAATRSVEELKGLIRKPRRRVSLAGMDAAIRRRAGR
jgi:AbrB family looped-hinge helix DNA binding protein